MNDQEKIALIANQWNQLLNDKPTGPSEKYIYGLLSKLGTTVDKVVNTYKQLNKE